MLGLADICSYRMLNIILTFEERAIWPKFAGAGAVTTRIEMAGQLTCGPHLREGALVRNVFRWRGP